MIDKEEITGIVLAGGKSSRLGQEKGLCLFRNIELVSYAIDTLKPLCGSMLVSANRYHKKYSVYGYPVIADEFENIGPMGGILSCLKHSHTRHNLVLSCDTPFVNTELLHYLLKHIENFQVVVPSHETFLIEPLSAYYSTNIIEKMEETINNGNYKMMEFFKEVGFMPVCVDKLPFYSDSVFLNINTPCDLQKAICL